MAEMCRLCLSSSETHTQASDYSGVDICNISCVNETPCVYLNTSWNWCIGQVKDLMCSTTQEHYMFASKI